MSVDVRVGNYNLDSSNFITDEGFSGFLGSTGTVGIDRDYDSLRQDLWLATDQSFKAAVENLSKKQAFMSRLAKAAQHSPIFPPAHADGQRGTAARSRTGPRATGSRKRKAFPLRCARFRNCTVRASPTI